MCFRIHLRIRGCLLKIHNHRVCTAPPSSAFDTESHRSRCTAGASGSARRLLPPESVSIGSLSAGAASAQHTHTVSICNSIAPHGRARPRVVTQMALGYLQMTYLPSSVSPPQGLVQIRSNREIDPS